MAKISLSAIILSLATAALGQDENKPVIPGASSYNGLALTPQMGWNDWNAFGCDINETILLDNARALVDYGLRDLGYKYVVLDDCWSSGRNSSGHLVEDSNKFPNVRFNQYVTSISGR